MVALLIVAGLCVGWTYIHQNGKKDSAEVYETAAITRGDLEQVVSASGDLNPLVKVEIGSQISGTIATRNVDFNSPVKKGDLLCELDPATYKANHAQAVAEQASAEAERDLQKRTLERKQQLLSKQFFAQADFDKAASDLRRAEAQVQLAAARVEKAKVDLDRCTIYAPIDGVVIDRTAEIGQTIAASFNAPKLFVLANDLTKMQINAKVSEADIGRVKPGQKVKFTVDAYEEEFTGEVVQVRNSPITEESVVNYDGIIGVDNPEAKLKPGMTATVSIITGERRNVLLVPNAALMFKPVPKDGRAGRAGRPEGRAEGRGPERGVGRGEGRGPGRGEGRGEGRGGARGPRSEGSPRSQPPKSATPGGGKQVYLPPKTPGGEPTPVKVEIGLDDDVRSEVLSGLSEGDVVITLLKPTENTAPQMTNPFGGMGGRRPR